MASVKVAGGTGTGPGAGGSGAAGAANGGAQGGGAGGKGQNKPCACPKSTSQENRDQVNEKTPEGKDLPCAVCGKTGPQVQSAMLRALDAAAGRTGSIAEKNEAAKLRAWWSKPQRSRLQADHIVPASQIKKRKDFQRLEATDLEGARRVMTAQTNMRGLCLRCNAAKGAKTKEYLGIADQTYYQKLNEIKGLIGRAGQMLH
jgi:hypothetical protein